MARARQPKIKPGAAVSAEEIDVALAWMRRDLNLSQVSSVFAPGQPVSGKALYRIASCLRAAHDQGLLKVVA